MAGSLTTQKKTIPWQGLGLVYHFEWVSLQNPHDLCINIITPNIFGSY